MFEKKTVFVLHALEVSTSQRFLNVSIPHARGDFFFKPYRALLSLRQLYEFSICTFSAIFFIYTSSVNLALRKALSRVNCIESAKKSFSEDRHVTGLSVSSKFFP